MIQEMFYIVLSCTIKSFLHSIRCKLSNISIVFSYTLSPLDAASVVLYRTFESLVGGEVDAKQVFFKVLSILVLIFCLCEGLLPYR